MKKIIFFTCSFLSIIILKAQYYGGNGGGFSLASSGTSELALPVDLLYFNAKAIENHQAQLNWQTASELNNHYFDVERSYDAINWKPIGKVAGNGTTNQITNYSFIDKTIAKNQQTAYYRLRQVDYDGTNEYIGGKPVHFTSKANAPEILVYPNPFNQEITIRINTTGLYSIEITDPNGLSLVHKENQDIDTQYLDVSDWTPGVYVIHVTSRLGNTYSKISKQ